MPPHAAISGRWAEWEAGDPNTSPGLQALIAPMSRPDSQNIEGRWPRVNF